mgnify:CR=1 FL=1
MKKILLNLKKHMRKQENDNIIINFKLKGFVDASVYWNKINIG